MVLGFWTDFELPDHLAHSAGSTAEFRDKEQVRTAQLEKGTGPAYYMFFGLVSEVLVD